MNIFSAKQHLSFCIYSIICFQWDNIISMTYTDLDLFFILGALIGCLIPDCDHKKALAGYIVPLYLIFKHGKQTHTILTSLIFIIFWIATEHVFWLGIWFGYFNHLITDNLQGNNLKFLYWPFKRRKK